MADGRAFVTEYAGPTNVVQDFDIDNLVWNASAFEGLSVVDAVEQLKNPRIGAVQRMGALPEHAWSARRHRPAAHRPRSQRDVRPVLRMPPNATKAWSTPRSGTRTRLRPRWTNGSSAPAEHAVQLLRDNPYLSRMYTVISPHEMTEDPMFHENAALLDVPNIRNATQTITCDGDSVWQLPDGREVFVPGGEPWPGFPNLPFAEEVPGDPGSGRGDGAGQQHRSDQRAFGGVQRRSDARGATKRRRLRVHDHRRRYARVLVDSRPSGAFSDSGDASARRRRPRAGPRRSTRGRRGSLRGAGGTGPATGSAGPRPRECGACTPRRARIVRQG